MKNMILCNKIMSTLIPHVIPADNRHFDMGVCWCGDINIVRQVLCANFIYNSGKTRCIFNKMENGYCDATTPGYDNVLKYNKGG